MTVDFISTEDLGSFYLRYPQYIADPDVILTDAWTGKIKGWALCRLETRCEGRTGGLRLRSCCLGVQIRDS